MRFDEPLLGIMASAGSGKTFSLAHRYVWLLAQGEPADSIVALTFSRKAGAEIFDAVILLLQEAAGSEEKARLTGERLGLPNLRRGDFMLMLDEVLEKSHRLQIGTLDQFMARLLSAYAFELGIPPRFRLVDTSGYEFAQVWKKTFREVFYNTLDEQTRTLFLQVFEHYSFGESPKKVMVTLQNLLDEWRHAFLQLNTTEPDFFASSVNPLVSLKEPLPPPPPRHVPEKFEQVASYLEAVEPHSPVFDKWGNKPIIDSLEALSEGRPIFPIMYKKKEVEATPPQARYWHWLMIKLIYAFGRKAVESTMGIWGVCRMFEPNIVRQTCEQGLLSFEDMQLLLAQAERSFSAYPSEKAWCIRSRLDAQYRHWLLDEFQDTSDHQWAVIRDFVDEVVQDAEQRRTVFMVGDVKQAIYGWRSGNARLFPSILSSNPFYKEALEQSFRSCPEIVTTVNRVFGKVNELALPPEVAMRWETLWRDHVSAVNASGYVELWEVPPQERGKIPFETKVTLLRKQLEAYGNELAKLNVAILCRWGKECRAFYEALSGTIPAPVHLEGRSFLKDYSVCVLMLSVLDVAFHPGDGAAALHIALSPLSAFPLFRNSKALLDELNQLGLSRCLRNWMALLPDTEPEGRGLLLQAAMDFEQLKYVSLIDFVAFAEEYQQNRASRSKGVRIMTIHASKGLGFDVVFLPLFDSQSILQQVKLSMLEGVFNNTHWICKAPRKEVTSLFPEWDAARSNAVEDQLFEMICLVYVAMTRAKTALHLFTTRRKRDGKTTFIDDFVGRCLGDANQELDPSGSRTFVLGAFPTFETKEEVVHSWESLPASYVPAPLENADRVRPSDADGGLERSDVLLGEPFLEQLALGSIVHELFEEVTWFEKDQFGTWLDAWSEHTGKEVDAHPVAVHLFKNSFNNPEVVRLHQQPDDTWQCFREFPLECVLQGQWVSGIIDRLLVQIENGKAKKACIIDYKTNAFDHASQLASLVNHYTPQLKQYQEMVASYYDLDASDITGHLVFTHDPRVVQIF